MKNFSGALIPRIVSLDGETVAVVTVEAGQIRAVERHEITHARRVA